MRPTILYILFVFIIHSPILSQDFRPVDEKIKAYPRSFSSPEKLASRINIDFHTDSDKARAIYSWLALNIEYDVKLYKSNPKATNYSYRSQEEKLQIERKLESDLARSTIREKKAVCQGYATLFKVLCDLTSLESVIISGYAKTKKQDIGISPDYITRTPNHAWNAIRLDDNWYLVDATWGAGYLDIQSDRFVKSYSDVYFLTDPAVFYLNHFPHDSQWLFVRKSVGDFSQLPLYYRDYQSSAIEIVSPVEGEIKVPKNGMIEIVIREAENRKVSFRFDKEQNAVLIKPEIRKELYHYEIKEGRGSYLTVYMDNVSVVTFKLNRR